MDKSYWDEFYKQHTRDSVIKQQSTFASFCQEEFFKDKKLNIIELGSGNCRDSIFFANKKHNVIAIDQSSIVIESKEHISLKDNLTIKVANFVTDDYSKYGDIDVFYSRFTMHAITKTEEEKIVKKVYDNLRQNGLFCIEVRTTKDPLYGVGCNMGDDTFFTDHNRRFINSDVFLKHVLKLGFKLRYFTEKNNLSIYKNDNPVLMRIILEK